MRHVVLRVVHLAAALTLALTVAGAHAQDVVDLPSLSPPVETTFADPSFVPLPGARAVFGHYDGGTYRIELPERWNERLVLVAHGYQGPSTASAVLGPGSAAALPAGPDASLRAHLIANHYAWASSSYRSTRYVPGLAARDTLLLRELFLRDVGTPERTYLFGTSMGGNVVALLMERFPTLCEGGVTECGVTAGSIEFFDYYAAVGAVTEFVTGVVMPSTPPDDYYATVQSVLGKPGSLTAEGKQFQNILINLSGGPRPFDTEGLALNYGTPGFTLQAFRDGNNDAPRLSGGISPLAAATGNVGVRYHIDEGLGLTDADLNAGVRRILPDPALRGSQSPYVDFQPMTGAIQRPLLSLHTTGDFTVPISMAQSYRQKVEQAGRGDLLVQRAIRNAGHCSNSVAEQVQAFDDLVAWAEGGPRPAGDDFLGDLADIGHAFTNPVRPGDPGRAADPPLPPPAVR
jgi:pimeloyl-ACP methyl ester carboxylesterase